MLILRVRIRIALVHFQYADTRIWNSSAQNVCPLHWKDSIVSVPDDERRALYLFQDLHPATTLVVAAIYQDEPNDSLGRKPLDELSDPSTPG
jgi:hypothetical protein